MQQNNKWSEENSNLIEDLIKAKELIKNSCLPKPNVIIITEQGKKFIKEVYDINLNSL